MEFLQDLNIKTLFKPEFLNTLLHILIILIAGLIVVRLIAMIVGKTFTKKAGPQMKMLVRKVIVYTGWAVIILAVLSELGVKLSAILGAAGIVGIAVGIASQKSLGSIISGFFLVSDKAFEVGDVIQIGDKVGVVHSIDLLSIKLKTLDNMLVRIPNDEIISSSVTNITRFPIRRMDFSIQVAYRTDLNQAREILLDIARQNPLCLDEPEPFFMFTDFGDSGIGIKFAVWFEKQNFVTVKNSVFPSIKNRFDEAGIEIPFPHTTLYTGEASIPFPVRVVEDDISEEKRSHHDKAAD
ncbi:MAG: mechanosensitive ion channel family protein [Spirochaetales bacterium]|nr:mechanosensitive ion channel family protein [Spirochaetales bacterium]